MSGRRTRHTPGYICYPMKCPACNAEAGGKFCSNCGAALGGATCRVCSAPLTPGARFCHLCGTALGARHGGRANAVPWIIAAVTVAVLVVVLVARTGTPSASAVGQGAGGGGSSPTVPPTGGMATTDISSMTPRERADRLFDRIMRAVSRGDSGEVRFFTPMALQAYGLLGALDPDARYHVALIQAEAGDLAAVAAQADSLEAAAPRHLFVSMLRAELAERRGNRPELQRWYRRFLDLYDAEVATGTQEYRDHQNALDAFRQQARAALGTGGP